MSDRPQEPPVDGPSDRTDDTRPIIPPEREESVGEATPRQRLRDRSWSMRALLVVALGAVALGGLAGAALASAGDHVSRGDARFGHHGPWNGPPPGRFGPQGGRGSVPCQLARPTPSPQQGQPGGTDRRYVMPHVQGNGLPGCGTQHRFTMRHWQGAAPTPTPTPAPSPSR